MDSDPATRDVALAYGRSGSGGAELFWQFLSWGWVVFAQLGTETVVWLFFALDLSRAAVFQHCRGDLPAAGLWVRCLQERKGVPAPPLTGISPSASAEGDQHSPRRCLGKSFPPPLSRNRRREDRLKPEQQLRRTTLYGSATSW